MSMGGFFLLLYAVAVSAVLAIQVDRNVEDIEALRKNIQFMELEIHILKEGCKK